MQLQAIANYDDCTTPLPIKLAIFMAEKNSLKHERRIRGEESACGRKERF